MRHAGRFFPLLLIALVPGLCLPARATDEKELRKAAPTFGNKDIQDVADLTMIETDKALANLDRQFQDYAISAASWREQARGVTDTFEVYAGIAYAWIDEIAETDAAEAKRLKTVVDHWQKVVGRFMHAKIITAGGAAMDLSEELVQNTEDLTAYRILWGKIDLGYVTRAQAIPQHYDQLVRDIAAVDDIDSGLKKRVGFLATSAANLGSAAKGRAEDAKEFLGKSDPTAKEKLYKALTEKAWAPSELAARSMYIPESWMKMLGEWSSVMATRYGTCLAAYGDAVVANSVLIDGKLFKDVPFFAGRDYEKLAEPIRALKNDL